MKANTPRENRDVHILWFCPEFHPRNSGYSNAFQLAIRSVLSHSENTSITVVTTEELGGQQEVCLPRLKVIRVRKAGYPRIGATLTEIRSAKKIVSLLDQNKFNFAIIETFDKATLLSAIPKRYFFKIAVRIHATSETEYNFFSNRLRHRYNRFALRHIVSRKIRWILSTNRHHIEFIKDHLFDGNLLRIANCNFHLAKTPAPEGLYEASTNSAAHRSIVMIGRMDALGVNQKGFHDLASALRLLGDDEKQRLTTYIIGEGPLRPELEKLFMNCGNVEFSGGISNSETLKILRNSDAAVLPSRYEGLSMFALESLSAGCVSIFSSTGGLRDLVNENGFLFPPQDVPALRKCLSDFLQLSNADLNQMKHASVKMAADHYSPKTVAKDFVDFSRLILSDQISLLR